jgi:iron complex outermembrane receptor protein
MVPPKKWKNTPAAIHVISKEDIASSSARSIPELLRGVPGIHVAQLDSNTWAVSSRGFTRRYSNKLLVLIDGRSIYTPLFSGVHWELNDIPLANIDRIEIIRGPGGSLWGANAVNGIINVITKSAIDTQGNYLKLGAGSFHKGFGTYRYGGINDDNNFAYRVTFNGKRNGHFNTTTNGNNKDDWKQLRLSTRIDWQPNNKDLITFSSGSYIHTSECATAS